MVGRRRLRATLVGILVVHILLVGCAPGTPDEDSWRFDATRAVGDVSSAVESARLALDLSLDAKLYDAYLQTVMVDAERLGEMAAQKLASVQPPDVEQRRASAVNDQLDRANGVLTEARIAVVASDTEEYADLVDELARTADDLSALEAALEHPPEEAATRARP